MPVIISQWEVDSLGSGEMGVSSGVCICTHRGCVQECAYAHIGVVFRREACAVSQESVTPEKASTV